MTRIKSQRLLLQERTTKVPLERLLHITMEPTTRGKYLRIWKNTRQEIIQVRMMHLFDWLAFCFCRLDEFGSTAKFTTTTGQTVELGKPAREVSPLISLYTTQKPILLLFYIWCDYYYFSLLLSEILIRNIRVKTTDILWCRWTPITHAYSPILLS